MGAGRYNSKGYVFEGEVVVMGNLQEGSKALDLHGEAGQDMMSNN
jgi:hypothetical protein